MKTIGITTTVPVEVLLAAGYTPVDLNNVFISSKEKDRLVGVAEQAGFPRNCCTWIKGIYSVAMEYGIDTVLCVTTGDCSNTLMLMEVLKLKRPNVLSFAYPDHPDVRAMEQKLLGLADMLGTTLEKAERVKHELETVRTLTARLDELTWKDGAVSGLENHYWLVSSSDFNSNVADYERGVQQLISRAQERKPYPGDFIRLAYIGVPSVFAEDFYPFLERNGARVVFNEVQRQFSMPVPCSSLAEQYGSYTYPYSISGRLNDIIPQLHQRRIDGIIHYVQAFCHRGIGDIVFRHHLKTPVLTLEGNTDFVLTQQMKTRIEAFLEMLRARPAIPVAHHLNTHN